MKPVVQISLDLTDIGQALETADMAMRAGVDWLEVGTPLILAEGMRAVRALRERYPETPLVADLKTMDGGWLEAEIMAEAGATHVVVMGQAHRETIERVVEAGEDFGVEVMGDNMAMPDPVEGARFLAGLGCDYIIHHIGYDFRNVMAERGEEPPSPLDRLGEIVNAVDIPVQAVGGLSVDQAIRTPKYGSPLVVIGAPLAIEEDRFEAASGVEDTLRNICNEVHAYGNIRLESK